MRPFKATLCSDVLSDVFAERMDQHERYDNDKTEFGFGPDTRWLLGVGCGNSAEEIQRLLRRSYEEFEDEAPVTFVHLVLEEVAEAFEAEDHARAYAELIQVAALAVSACEQMKRRKLV